MNTRILTALERKRIERYLKADGEKEQPVRMLVVRARRYQTQLRQDMELIDRLLTHYEKK